MINVNDIKIMDLYESRNRIVFCLDIIEGLEFHNVGFELADILKSNSTKYQNFSSILSIFNSSCYNDLIGRYLAIDNIGILFEPELKLDVRSIIESYSKNQCLIIRTDAKIKDDKLFFLSQEDGIEVSLSGLTYKQIR